MRKAFYLFFLVTIIISFTACSSDKITKSPKNDIGYVQTDAETAKKLMDTESGYIILDVRTEDEYREKHIPGAILIPDYEISERAGAELPDKDQLILVYCRSGNRSKTASQSLADMGYTNVIEFGGINSWPYETVNEQ